LQRLSIQPALYPAIVALRTSIQAAPARLNS
jgi:hypothetical protein